MVRFDILKKLENKETSADELVEHVKGDLDLLPVVYEGVTSGIAHVRYPCAKVLMLLSEESPELLYPNMDFFIEMLDSEKRILKWAPSNH